MVIRYATKEDSESIARIYNHYVANTIVTFEEQIVSAEEIEVRMDDILSCSLPYFVVENNELVIGYAYATKWKTRSAYRFSVETTIYIDPDFVGKGYGSKLYRTLLEQLSEKKLHVAMGSIALPNEGSVALHEKIGFKKAAHFSEVGYKFERWIDTGYWQCLL